VPGCSGWGGCESKNHPRQQCPAWPSGVPKCDATKMSRAYCAQNCLAWTSAYIYSGTAFADECWCGSELSATDVNTAAAEAECTTKCKGDGAEVCVGLGRIVALHYRPSTLYQIC
jgi:hypothetical protein